MEEKNLGGRPLKNKLFKSEKEMTDYLVENKDFWVQEWFGSGEFTIQEQFHLKYYRVFGANKPKIDLCIEYKDGKRIGIEIKNPKQKYHELSRAVSQLMSYMVIAEENGVPFDEVAIITSDYDSILSRIVKKFNLPIRVFIIDKLSHGEIL